MVSLRQHPRVDENVGHLCQRGLQTQKATAGRAPALKPIRFLSSAPKLSAQLVRKCPRDREHQRLAGGRARAAAVYPPELFRAMLGGIEAQRWREGSPMCQHLSIELDRGCVLYALVTSADATQSGTTRDEARPEEEQENVWDEAENLP